MRQNSGQILAKLSLDALPFGFGAGTFFAGNFLATGSVLEVAEIGFLAGFGAGIAMTGVIVIGAVALPVGIALAIGNNKLAGDLSDAVHDVTPLLSPGVIALMPISPLFTPSDPALFAKGVGPGFDLLMGGLSSATLDKIGAELSALGAFQGWKSDIVSLGNYYLSSPISPSLTTAQGPDGGRPSPAPSPRPSAGGEYGAPAGFPFDFNAPGDGDAHGESPSTNGSSDIPTFTMTIEVDDPNSPGASGTTGGASDPGNGTDAGPPPGPGNGSGNDNGGEDAGTETGGDGQTNPGTAGESGPGNSSGGDEGSGGSEGGDGGGDEGGSD